MDGLSEKLFSRADLARSRSGPNVHAFSSLASLDPAGRGRRIPHASQQSFDARDVATAVHRYQELIAGHPYLIEVSSVSSDRWRAYIVRIPGLPTALMPFYGATPDAAAGLLRDWLTRAHQRAGTSRVSQ